ncbi:MAG: HIT domain-containing protein [Rhodobacteraceae bacterium]|nr:HIT domain-containing protein [Paracoccaceae bacterium]MCY4197686.1 HIT domain-containing protein [Paracoccaceae bacterium]MCY4325982.1 HIT domain-containing protein [Paracoccaceae bacterium]
MSISYDQDNIFAKILRGELPCDKVLETDHSLAFRDIAPLAPDHVLVIPKGAYICFEHFSKEASVEEMADFVHSVGEVVRLMGIDPGSGGGGYRLISNAGMDGGQEVPHFHVHVVGGRRLGPILAATNA